MGWKGLGDMDQTQANGMSKWTSGVAWMRWAKGTIFHAVGL